MRQRGRKGIAQTETAGALTVVARPDAPLDLTPDETDEWHAVVDALPADWFPRETWPLLAQFCRHTVSARRVAQLIDAEMAKAEMDLRNLKEFLTLQRGETAALKALAASMRISQQSTWNAKSGDTAKAKRTVKRLWEG
jgi:hypothetical protein